MAIRIKARGGESTEQMMRRFKKLCEKEGLTKDIKRREFYEKPSERARRSARKSLNRRLKSDLGTLNRGSVSRKTGAPSAQQREKSSSGGGRG